MRLRGFITVWRLCAPPAAVFLFAAALNGCGDAVPAAGTSGGSNPEAIAEKIRPMIEPLQALLAAPPQDNGNFVLVNPEWCQNVADQVRKAKAEYEKTDQGKVALAKIADDLENLIRRARDEDRWGLVLCAIDVHEQLRPNMHLMRLLRDRAFLHAMRPHVVVKGFFGDNDRDQLYVFLKVTLRAGYHPWPDLEPADAVPVEAEGEAEGEGEAAAEGEGEGEGEGEAGNEPLAVPAAGKLLKHDEVHRVQVRLNEEFYGLRLVDVVGNKRGVVLEYLADPGHTFQVMLPPKDYRPPKVIRKRR